MIPLLFILLLGPQERGVRIEYTTHFRQCIFSTAAPAVSEMQRISPALSNIDFGHCACPFLSQCALFLAELPRTADVAAREITALFWDKLLSAFATNVCRVKNNAYCLQNTELPYLKWSSVFEWINTCLWFQVLYFVYLRSKLKCYFNFQFWCMAGID